MCEPSVGDRPKYPMLTAVSITDEAILSYMSAGPDRESARLTIHAAMDDLRKLSFDVNFDSPIPGRRLFWQGDHLFHIVKIEHVQEGIFGGESVLSTVWAVRAGLWALAWFTPDTRQYIGSMARVLLRLGNRGNRLVAKKIGQRLLLLSQNCRPRGLVEIFVHELLEDIGELLLPEKREKNWASRIRTYVEEAMELLEDCGVFKKVEWPDGSGPGDIDRSKGWSDRWLNARIRVTTMANRRAESGSARAQRSFGKREDGTDRVALTGAEIRFARTNIAPPWTQEELAKRVRTSRRHLSQIETEKRKPSPMLANDCEIG
jgi:DNA-binding transcriptional regulator YiaG